MKARKFKRYTKKEKEIMVALYEAFKSYEKASKKFGCALSTIYYAVNRDAYERHLDHIHSVNYK